METCCDWGSIITIQEVQPTKVHHLLADLNHIFGDFICKSIQWCHKQPMVTVKAHWVKITDNKKSIYQGIQEPWTLGDKGKEWAKEIQKPSKKREVGHVCSEQKG